MCADVTWYDIYEIPKQEQNNRVKCDMNGTNTGFKYQGVLIKEIQSRCKLTMGDTGNVYKHRKQN